MPGAPPLTLETGEAAELKIGQYWEIPAAETQDERDDASWIRECRERLEETVADAPDERRSAGRVFSPARAGFQRHRSVDVRRTFTGAGQDIFRWGTRRPPTANSLTPGRWLTVSGRSTARSGGRHGRLFPGCCRGFLWFGTKTNRSRRQPSSVSLYFCIETGLGAREGGSDRRRQAMSCLPVTADYRHYLWNARWLPYYRMASRPGAKGCPLRFVAGSRLLSGESKAETSAHLYRARRKHRISLPGRTVSTARFQPANRMAWAPRPAARPRIKTSSNTGTVARTARCCRACCMPIKRPTWSSC